MGTLDNKISETQKVHSVTADANAVILKHTIWAKHQMFSLISSTLQKYLSIPATSVPCEHVFFLKQKFCTKKEIV